jgi:hypothetical protein
MKRRRRPRDGVLYSLPDVRDQPVVLRIGRRDQRHPKLRQIHAMEFHARYYSTPALPGRVPRLTIVT